MISPFEILGAGVREFVADPVILIGFTVFGVLYGMSFGLIPGVSSVVAMLSLIPLAFVMPITQSLVLFAAIYCGGTFGGAFSSILMNIPGAAENVATSFDGFPMQKKGLAGKAMGATVTCSAIGGLVGAMAFIFTAPYLANVALGFSDADYFGIIIMGLLVVGSISGRSVSSGLISVGLGLLVGTVGISVQTMQERFTFGSPTLTAGFTFVAIMIGTFALSEIFFQFASALKAKTRATIGRYTGSSFTLLELWQQKFNMLRSSVVGTVCGFVPGIGATLASFASYGLAKSVSKTPEKFGTGVLEGVVAPETANNAATGGAMIPLFTLGIPGGAATAVMLAVFLSQGLQPSPMIFFKQLPMVGAVMVSLILANLLILPAGRYGVHLLVKGLRLNLVYLVVIVAVFCAVGTFSFRNLMLDPYSALVAGIVGYYWRVYGFPGAPFIIGVVLGPMAEARFMNAMILQDMNILRVLSSPVGLGFMLVGMIFVLAPIVERVRARKGLMPTEPEAPKLGSLIIYIILIGISIFLWYQTTTWAPMEGRVGTAVWPCIALGLIMSMSLLRIFQWLAQYRRTKKAGAEIDLSLKRFFGPGGACTFLPILLFGGYYLLINIVGYVLLTLLFSFITLYVGGVRRPLPMLLFSFVLTGIISLIFIGTMQLYMPEGIGIFADFHYWLYDYLFTMWG